MSPKSGRVLARVNPKYQKSGLKSYAWLLSKYNITPTQDGPFFRTAAPHSVKGQSLLKGDRKPVGHLMKRVAAGDSEPGKVTTKDVQTDSLYLSEVEIGTPPQKFWLDFDTGSSDLWVFGTEVKHLFPATSAHNFFDPSASTTPFKSLTDSKFEIHFGDGSWAKGVVGLDDVTVGGITVRQQAVEIATEVSNDFISGEGDGLLGLGFGVINSVTPSQVKTPVENMILQKDIKAENELFTCKLGSWKDTEEADKGESFYTFGFIDKETVTATGGEIFYTNIDSSHGWWKFPSTSATVNGTVIHRSSSNTAIADTGTTLALLDDSTVKKIYTAIHGAKFDAANQGWVYPLGTKEDKLPVVTLAVGTKQFVIQKEDLGFVAFKDSHGKEWVYGGIQSRGDLDFDILGDTFLKGIYAIFDVGKKRFGAVQRKELRQNLDFPIQD